MSWAAMVRRWLSIAALASGCTPIGGAHPDAPPELEIVEPEVAVVEEPVPGRPRHETACGGLVVAGQGEWRTDDPVLPRLREHWHPRAEHGRPIAVRHAAAPIELSEHAFVEVRVHDGPRDVIRCYTPDEPAFADACTSIEAVTQRFVTHRDEMPADARTWAVLLGTLDGASAVFESREVLERCAAGLSPEKLANVATLGMHSTAARTTVTFVERLDPSPALTMLVVVKVVLEEYADVDREELLTIDREVER